MRAVVQRVLEASVQVDGEMVGQIARGLLVFVGVEQGDDQRDADYLAGKISGLRVFEDDSGLMNRSVADTGGGCLVISQFTLMGDVRRGKRPSFTAAAPPAEANQLYEYLCDRLSQQVAQLEQGVFQADMKVALINDGPVTIMLDSRKLF